MVSCFPYIVVIANICCEINVSFINDSIAQLVEHYTFNVRVTSSNLVGVTINSSCEVPINYRNRYTFTV